MCYDSIHFMALFGFVEITSDNPMISSNSKFKTSTTLTLRSIYKKRRAVHKLFDLVRPQCIDKLDIREEDTNLLIRRHILSLTQL